MDEGIARAIYPTTSQQRYLLVSLENCSFTYKLPSSIDKYSKLDNFDGEVLVQLEKDFRLYLIPPASDGVVAIVDAAYLRMVGFSISPNKKHCEQKSE